MDNKEQEKTSPLYPLISTHSQLRREAAKRKKPYDIISVKKEHVPEYLNQNWIIDKELKLNTRLKKLKPIDERLENRFWFLLYRLGYHELNYGRNFQIEIKRKGADPIQFRKRNMWIAFKMAFNH